MDARSKRHQTITRRSTRSSESHDDTMEKQQQQQSSNRPEPIETAKTNSNNNATLHATTSTTEQPQQQRPSWFVLQVTLLACLGGVLFGYDLGVISGALPLLTADLQLSSRQQELVVSILYLGGGLGASMGGSLVDMFGRQRSIVGIDVVFLLGAILLFVAGNLTTIVVGRIVVGFAIACSGIADVTYLHEISPTAFRGAIVSANEASISLGFLLAFGVGSLVDSWRLMFGISGLVALIQLVGMLGMPESPLWLMERGRVEEARLASEMIHNGRLEETGASDPQNYQSVKVDIELSPAPLKIASCSESPISTNQNGVVRVRSRVIYLCKQCRSFVNTIWTNYRKQAYIVFFLAFCQQFCGQASVLCYAHTILHTNSGWSTLSIGVVKFIVTVVVVWKIEQIGRRALLLSGIGTIAAGLLLLAISYSGIQDVENTDSKLPLALPGVLFVVMGYSMSFGPLTWLLTSELFPTEFRGRALGISTIMTYLCASIVTNTFLSSQAWLGASVVFACYLLITVLGFVFAYLAIPDTGGKSAREIELDLVTMPWWIHDRDEQETRTPLT